MNKNDIVNIYILIYVIYNLLKYIIKSYPDCCLYLSSSNDIIRSTFEKV